RRKRRTDGAGRAMTRTLYFDCSADMKALYESTEGMADILPSLELRLGDPDPSELPGLLSGYTGVLNGHTRMSAELLDACPDVKVVVFLGTGVASYVDMEAAAARGIAVHGIAGYGNRTIAEHSLALMLAGVRGVARLDREMRAGTWRPDSGFELEGKTLGIVGLGGVGRTMAKLGAALGMKVIAWNRSGVPSDLPCTARKLHDLLAEADVVSLHVSLTNETAGILDARRLALLKPSTILVNTARGGLVDEAALVSTLQEGRIAHAALDTFAEEPLTPDHPLTKLNNVTLTSHAGFMTREAATRLLQSAYELTTEALAKT
ncbi:MAG: NAD(P)-dependent oxidoreductase, partial [Alphaproteobacteria bacterium]|nr:NAD(P)-dependent oxidoreductase [Alphaproteobacteria bacterium]